LLIFLLVIAYIRVWMRGRFNVRHRVTPR